MEGDARIQGSLGRDRLERHGFLRAGTARALTACVPGASTSPTASARGRGATTEAAPADAKRTLAELDQTGSLAGLATMDATEVAERVALGELTPIDTLTATSARIAALEPDLAVLSPFTMSLARASRGLPPDAANRARREFDGLGSRVVEWMKGVDVFVSPVLPEAPPPVDRWGPRSDWVEVQGAFRSDMTHTPPSAPRARGGALLGRWWPPLSARRS
jgi:hypothetical protein